MTETIKTQTHLSYLTVTFRHFADLADKAAHHISRHNPTLANQYRMQRDTWAQAAAIVEETTLQHDLSPDQIKDLEQNDILNSAGPQTRLIARLLWALSATHGGPDQ